MRDQRVAAARARNVSRVYGEQVRCTRCATCRCRSTGRLPLDRRAVGLGQVDDARPARRARSDPTDGHDPDRGAGRRARSTTRPGRELRGDSIGFVFQQFHLIPHLTALGNVETALLYRGLRRARATRAAMAALEQVGLGAPRRPPAGADVGWRAAARRDRRARSSPSRSWCSPTSPPARSTRATPRSARDLQGPRVARAGGGDGHPRPGDRGDRAPQGVDARRRDRRRRARRCPAAVRRIRR